MENMERFTLLYAIAYVILNGTENLRFDKDGYFDAVIFYGLFYKGNRKHFLRVPIRYGNTWKFERKLRGNIRPTGLCSHFNFSLSQTFTRVSITVWKHRKCFLFLKLNSPYKQSCKKAAGVRVPPVRKVYS